MTMSDMYYFRALFGKSSKPKFGGPLHRNYGHQDVRHARKGRLFSNFTKRKNTNDVKRCPEMLYNKETTCEVVKSVRYENSDSNNSSLDYSDEVDKFNAHVREISSLRALKITPSTEEMFKDVPRLLDNRKSKTQRSPYEPSTLWEIIDTNDSDRRDREENEESYCKDCFKSFFRICGHGPDSRSKSDTSL